MNFDNAFVPAIRVEGGRTACMEGRRSGGEPTDRRFVSVAPKEGEAKGAAEPNPYRRAARAKVTAITETSGARSGDGRLAVLGEQIVRGLGHESLDGGVALGDEQLERRTGLARRDSWPRISGADFGAGRRYLTS